MALHLVLKGFGEIAGRKILLTRTQDPVMDSGNFWNQLIQVKSLVKKCC